MKLKDFAFRKKSVKFFFQNFIFSENLLFLFQKTILIRNRLNERLSELCSFSPYMYLNCLILVEKTENYEFVGFKLKEM